MQASAVRCRACGSRRRAFRSPRKPQPRFAWKFPPRTTAAGVCSAKAGRSIAPADAYLKFMKTFEPLRGWIGRRARLSDADAFTARILLIHYYRRVVLRDPLLPTALLPKDWPGRAARQLCGEIYRGLLPASEQWLDRNGSERKRPVANCRRRAGAPLRQLICYRNILHVDIYVIYLKIPAIAGGRRMYTQALNTSDAEDRNIEDATRAARFRRASTPRSASSPTTGCPRPIARR